MTVQGAFPGLPFQHSLYRAHKPVFSLPPADRHDIARLPRADVVVVLAHPDDETFITGTLKKLTESGYGVQLVYATSGDAGKNILGRKSHYLKNYRTLGTVREQELTRALKTLKINRAPVMLRYPDGAVDKHMQSIQDDVRKILQATQPQIVISFGFDGMTGHPDHINMGEAVSNATQAESVPNYQMTLSNDAIQQAELDWPLVQGSHPVDVRVDVRGQDPAMKRSMKKHATQYNRLEVEQVRAWYMRYPYEEFTRDPQG